MERGDDGGDGDGDGPSPPPPNGESPPIVVKEDGVEKTLYIQYPDWAEARTDGDLLWYDFNNRMYLSESQTLDKSQYYKPNLLGGSFSYDVDLSNVSCGCVSALYTVLMPGAGNGDDFGYCDAN